MDETTPPPPAADEPPDSSPSLDEGARPLSDAARSGDPDHPADWEGAVGGETTEPPPRRHRLHFGGSGGEYFRIWYVNLILTVVTVGIYAAWAKVRTRRYLYAHTRLADLPFDYLAEPLSLLKGNLIVAVGVILYTATNYLSPKSSAVVALLFALATPFLIYKSLRFFAHNTSYRNLRCRFHGGLGECYRLYLLMPVLIPLTLGLILPYWAFRRQRYFYANLAYGDHRPEVAVTSGALYRYYGLALLLSLLIVGSGVGLGGALAWAVGTQAGLADRPELRQQVVMGVTLVCGYGASLLVYTVVGQYLKARTMNCFLNNTRLAGLHMVSAIGARRLAWIQASNLVLMLLSLGLLIPWATVRRSRYLLESITVIESDGELDRIGAAASLPESALGDAATDYFDLDVGF